MSTNNAELSAVQTSPKDEATGSDAACPFRSLRNFGSKESDDEQVRIRFQLGSEIRTSLVFEWSKRGWFANG